MTLEIPVSGSHRNPTTPNLAAADISTPRSPTITEVLSSGLSDQSSPNLRLISFNEVSEDAVSINCLPASSIPGNGLRAEVSISQGSKGEFRSLCCEWFEDVLEEVANQPNSPTPAAPVLLVSENPPPEEWYWEAVTAHVELQSRIASIHDEGCWILSGEEKWGAVGASAAIAWSPGITSTWELIAWRNHELIGQPRKITSEAVRMMEGEHPLTFVNRDPTAGRGLIASSDGHPLHIQMWRP
jgi:hypothetical protein